MNILNIGYQSTNYYLLPGGNFSLLVDAGWPGTFGKFLHVLRTKGLSLEAIDYFFVTHFHPDHAGLVQELKESGRKFILLEEQQAGIPLMKKIIKPDTGYKDIDMTGVTPIPASMSRAFLKGLGFDGELVHTPGHSDDSISLVLDSGEAFTGDLPLGMPDESNVAFCRSRMKLRDLGVTRIFPAHGPIGLPFPFTETF
jgi:glyoxylase-like metal-dependent hydrolase (beta-lactamase superfamily II)